MLQELLLFHLQHNLAVPDQAQSVTTSVQKTVLPPAAQSLFRLVCLPVTGETAKLCIHPEIILRSYQQIR